jgi:hypothetical protein
MIESHPCGPDNEELVSKKKPHEMNEDEQGELLEHLTEVFSGMPCDFSEVEMTEDQRREYEKRVAREAQSDAGSMERWLQHFDKLPESEWPDGLFYQQGVSIRTLMQKRRVATAEQRRDCLAFYWSVFRKCPSCGTANNPDVRWCNYCGSELNH